MNAAMRTLLVVAAVAAGTWGVPALDAADTNIYGIHFWGSGASGIMNGRQGYSVENVWPGVQNKTDWSDIRSKVQGARNDGFVPIVRFNWTSGQTVPALNDWVGRYDFAHKCAEGVQNLGDLCNIWQIGNEMNASWEGAIPADWYLKCFNTYDSNNCYTQIHSVQSTAIVCLGAVAPWNADTNATGPYDNTHEKWKNYWYYLVNNAGVNTDGFTIHAYGGRQNGQPGDSGYDPDPRDDCNAPNTISTQTIDVSWGFGAFRYFADEVATTYGDNRPVYCTETNTNATAVPSISYRTGWMQGSFEAIDTYNKTHFQKIRTLSWFVYDPAGAWVDFSLCCGGGQMPQARSDYQSTCNTYNYQWTSNTPDTYVYTIDTGASDPNSVDPNGIVPAAYVGKYENWQGANIDWLDGGPNGQTDYWLITQSRVFSAATDGSYGFQTTSQDGSWLFVDGKLVVNNAGLKSSPVTASGSVTLTAGYHWVYVKFFAWTGNAYTGYQYQPPGAQMTTMADSPAPNGNALVYNLDTGLSNTGSSDFTQIVPASYVGAFGWNGVGKNWGSGGPIGTSSNWIIMQPFVFWVAANQTYTFKLSSDDGSWLWVDGQVVVNNSGVKSKTVTKTGTKALVAGWHTGFAKFFKTTGVKSYSSYQWKPPNRGGSSTVYDPIPVY